MQCGLPAAQPYQTRLWLDCYRTDACFILFVQCHNDMRTILAAKVPLSGLILTALIVFFACVSEKKAEDRPISFNFQVRPILSDRCFKCHGPDEKQRKADLRLDTREGALAALGPNKDHFAIVPGHPEQSTLVHRIYSAHPDSIMPTPDSHLSLSASEKQILTQWIAEGANWEKHWAFIAPEKTELPTVSNTKWPKNEIDYFILAAQEEQGLTPNPEAEKSRLARRAAFDLTGLPPRQALLDRFLEDKSPEAFEWLVDSLLADPAYGERWTTYWLDLARYSDSHGYQDDLTRVMWPWRDWVIHAFNQNMPYDQFVIQQLAGDLLPGADKANLLASAFNRNHKITQEGGVIDEEYRVEYVADRTNTFGKAFLGLTMECARCHDHKYDPISMREYYATFAFFNQIPEVGFVPNLATPAPYMKITLADAEGALRFLNLGKVLSSPADSLLQMVMRDSVGIRKTHILARGQYDKPEEEVRPDLPNAVLSYSEEYAPNRLGMTQWLFDKKNPLTARVMINRLWQELFGKGIVSTSDNFGLQGALPTHPALLDWLSADFRDNGWDIKKALRRMVLSATYRQSAVLQPGALERDPENRWLARGPRYRMQYEFIRDNALVASGLLVRQLGGPPVRPYQPPGLWEALSTEKSSNNYRGEYSYVPDTLADKRYRRSLYTFNRRTIPPPAALAFDALPRDVCEVSRGRTSTPLQALAMLNDPQILEAARVLSGKLLEANQKAPVSNQIQVAFRQIISRIPSSEEVRILEQLYTTEYQRYQQSPHRAKRMLEVGRYPFQSDLDPAIHCALMLTVSAIFNLDEALSKS